MQIIAKNNIVVRRGVQLYRKMRYRKGFGVHSPFVFNLITKVIEEPGSYYPLTDIALIRKQLLLREDIICYPKKKAGKIKQSTMGRLVGKKAISTKQGALLFKLTNYFKPKAILQIGTQMGLSTLYMTTYGKQLHCIALEETPEYGSVAKQVFDKWDKNAIDLRIGNYQKQVPMALQDLGKLDFVFFNTTENAQNMSGLFNECLRYAHPETIFVFQGIRSSIRMHKFWKEICALPEVTVTLDLYSWGIVFINEKLYKRNYKCCY